jgi:ankyrin repeat protein
MVAVLAVLCVVIRAECKSNADAEDFLTKALSADKSELAELLDQDGRTPLVVVAAIGCPSYVEDLVNMGFDINGLDARGFTALGDACLRGELGVVRELIRLGADIEIESGEIRMTALMCAACQGNVENVKLLQRAGARVNTQDRDGRTAIWWAANRGHAEILQLLVEDGADPDLTGETEGPPLWGAAYLGKTEAVKVLVQKGADLEVRFNGSTPLHAAAKRNNTRIVTVLVEAGADIDALDDDGNGALHYAALKGNVGMLRLLKAGVSSLDTPDGFGETALHLAVTSGSAPVVEEVLSWDVIDINAGTTLRATALHYAAAGGAVKLAELLIDAGADVNAVMEVLPGVEYTVLHAAAFQDEPEVVELLMRAGAEVDPSGLLLIEAALRNCSRAVKVLLQARDWPDDLRAALEADGNGPEEL